MLESEGVQPVVGHLSVIFSANFLILSPYSPITTIYIYHALFQLPQHLLPSIRLHSPCNGVNYYSSEQVRVLRLWPTRKRYKSESERERERGKRRGKEGPPGLGFSLHFSALCKLCCLTDFRNFFNSHQSPSL